MNFHEELDGPDAHDTDNFLYALGAEFNMVVKDNPRAKVLRTRLTTTVPIPRIPKIFIPSRNGQHPVADIFQKACALKVMPDRICNARHFRVLITITAYVTFFT